MLIVSLGHISPPRPVSEKKSNRCWKEPWHIGAARMHRCRQHIGASLIRGRCVLVWENIKYYTYVCISVHMLGQCVQEWLRQWERGQDSKQRGWRGEIREWWAELLLLNMDESQSPRIKCSSLPSISCLMLSYISMMAGGFSSAPDMEETKKSLTLKLLTWSVVNKPVLSQLIIQLINWQFPRTQRDILKWPVWPSP